ncbi:MAG: DUF371 domain-containing protein [Crenarchaeota archaeon]|nr:DUF371 domain-containing protein [Thermoproteota archaeon]
MPARLVLLRCRGHPNVQLAHASTLELEAGERLTIRGDCVACVACRGPLGEVEEAASRRGLAKLFIAAWHPWPPRVEAAVVDGLSPAERPQGRLVVRRSCHRRGSVMVAASASASTLPRGLASLLSSGYSVCYALLVYYTPQGAEAEVDAVYEAAGCVVEDAEGRGQGPGPAGETL